MADLVPYHDRDGLIWFDGKLVPWREAQVHLLTHALHYASSVFEGERAYSGEIFKLTEHTERLMFSAKMLDFDIPYTVGRDRSGLPRDRCRQQFVGLLCPPNRLAWQRTDGRVGPAVEDPLGCCRLELGLVFPHGTAPQRYSHSARRLQAA